MGDAPPHPSCSHSITAQDKPIRNTNTNRTTNTNSTNNNTTNNTNTNTNSTTNTTNTNNTNNTTTTNNAYANATTTTFSHPTADRQKGKRFTHSVPSADAFSPASWLRTSGQSCGEIKIRGMQFNSVSSLMP